MHICVTLMYPELRSILANGLAVYLSIYLSMHVYIFLHVNSRCIYRG